MKSITIAGNIGRDAVVRTTGGGDKVTSWTIAVEDRQNKDKPTLWFDCSMWGPRGEKLAEYLTKGGKVVVSGDLSTREHEGKTYLSVRADQVTLMGARQNSEPSDAEVRREFKKVIGAEVREMRRDVMDDEIPF
jgi:single-strand DNA-binding protein